MLHAIQTNISDLVVIGGCQRSGTTLVHRLLSSHSDVHGVMTDTAVFNNYAYFAKLTGIDQPATTDQMKSILCQLLTSTNVRKWELMPDEAMEFASRFAPGWDSVFLCLLAAIQQKHGVPVTALKHPGGEHAFLHLRELFHDRQEGIRFVYCVRNPLDTYRSWKHRTTSWFDRDRPETLPLRWSAIWLKSTLQLLEFRHRFPDEIKVIRFTDLLNSPAAVVAELCDYVGLDDQSETMIELLDAEPNSSFRDSNLPKVQGGVVDVHARLKEELSVWEVDAIRAACSQRAATFGYDLGLPSEACDEKKIMHDVALENIPTRELVRYGLHLVARRAWTRCFRPPLRCDGSERTTSFDSDHS